MSIFPHDEVPTVRVVGVGDPDPGSVQVVAETYEAEFEVPVTVGETIPLDDQSGQRDSADVLFALEETPELDFVIGVTDEKLYYRERNSIFGLVSWDEGYSLVSTGALHEDGPSETTKRERIENVTRHCAGQLFEFRSHKRCVMDGVDTLDELDDRPNDFCRDCADRLRREETAPEPPQWQVLTQGAEEMETAIRWSKGDIRLTEYPLFALGMVVDGVWRLWDWLPSSPSVSVPRSVRAFVHESYRTISFWWLVLTYFAVFLAVVGVGLTGYESATGGATSDVAMWAIVVAGLPIAYVVHAILTGIFGGLLAGTVTGVRDGLAAEK
ncbi:zinc metalloprotease [Halorussus halophilus]|uniref:hypothetical protein n=1 Tax=Halorussus halophilus TaxID=2650975 RepID=UPI00130123D8|nr:hypothetical protein [Halorussus halophilus]